MLAVAQGDQAVGVGGGGRIVGDHDHRLAELVDRLAQQPQHVLAGLRVEVAGRLVGEDDGRFGDQRAGDGDPLLLAAGELGGPVRATVLEADRADQLLEPLRVGLAAGDREWQHEVLLGGEHWQQVEELEDEAELVAAQLGQVGVVEARDLLAVEHHRAEVGLSRPARMCIRVDLPEPDGPMIAVKRPRSNPVADVDERVDRGLALTETARDARCDDDLPVHAHARHAIERARWGQSPGTPGTSCASKRGPASATCSRPRKETLSDPVQVLEPSGFSWKAPAP